MLALGTVAPDTLELLRHITSLPQFHQTRLVGGTALALQYGHRKSIDLDFFGVLDSEPEETQEELETLGTLKVIKQTRSIRIYLLNGVKIDFVDYSRYPWLDAPILEAGVCIATPKDIAAMKVNAIEGRGSRKDFVDIFALLQHFTLSEILSFYQAKYPEHSVFRALMSLTYFEDAETQPMPEMLSEISWQQMKATIIDTVRRYHH